MRNTLGRASDGAQLSRRVSPGIQALVIFLVAVVGGTLLFFVSFGLGDSVPAAGRVLSDVYEPGSLLALRIHEAIVGAGNAGDDMAGLLPVLIGMWIQSVLMVLAVVLGVGWIWRRWNEASVGEKPA